jgi:tRNA(Ile)-lysidine synthase
MLRTDRLAALPPALQRLVVQQLADRVAGRPVPGAARHAEEVAALRRTGKAMLDLGAGVRAVAERGVLRAERAETDL